MNAAKTNSQDLLLKIVDGPGDSVIPVKSATCMLKEIENSSGVRLECSLLRDKAGAEVKSASEGVTINGSPAFGQRLKIGDQIGLGSKAYEVMQLGSLSNDAGEHEVPVSITSETPIAGEKVQLVRIAQAKTTPRSSMIEKLKQSEPQMSSDQINNRIDRIESELGRQSENFENVNKRFDDLGQQMAALINAVGGGNAPAAEVPVVESSIAETEAVVAPVENTESSSQEAFSLPTTQPSTQPTESTLVETHSISEAQPELQQNLPSDATTVEEPVAQESSDSSWQSKNASELDAVFGQLPAKTESEVVEPAEALTEKTDVAGVDVTTSSPDDVLLDVFHQGECDEECSGQCEEQCEATSQQLNDVASDDQQRSLNDVFQGLEATPVVEAQSESNFETSEPLERSAVEENDAIVEATGQEPLTDEESQRMLDRLSALTGTPSMPVGDESEGETADQVASASQTESTEEVPEISNQQLENDAEQTLDNLLSSLNSISGNENTTSEELQAETLESDVSELNTESPAATLASDSAAEEDSGQLEGLFATLREKDRLADENEQLEAETASENATDLSDQSTEPESPEAGSLSAGLLEAIANDDVREKPTLSLREQMGISVPTSSPREEQPTSESEPAPVENRLLQDLEKDPQGQQEKPVLSLREQMGLNNLTPASEEEAETDSSGDESTEAVNAEEPSEQSDGSEEASTQSSVADILSRMNMLPTDESSDVSGLVENTKPESIQPVQPEPATVAADEPQSGEDVHDYMNSLLQRLNGGEPAEKPAEAKKPETAPAEEKADPAKSEPAESLAPVIPVEPLNPEEFIPSHTAPERTSDLAAMRELANASSRNAVQRSQINKRKVQSNNLLIIAIAGVFGAALTAILSQQTGDAFYLLALALFGVTAIASGIYAATNFFGMDMDLSKLLSFLPKGKKGRFTNGIAALSGDAEMSDEQEVVDAALANEENS